MRLRAAMLMALIVSPCVASGPRFMRPLPDLVGVRVAAMGDAAVGLEDSTTGFFHNPANLGLGEGVVIFGQTNVAGRDRVEFDPKGVSYRWRGWGLAWGNKLAETAAIADYTYLSVGRRFASCVSVGVSGKFWRTHPSDNFQILGNSPTSDLGLIVSPNDDTRVGVRFGQLHRGEGVAQAAIGASHRFRELLTAVEGAWVNGERIQGRVGAEWTPLANVALRFGLRGSEPTAGAGVRVQPFVLNFAVTRVQETTTLFVGANFILIE